MKNNVLVIALTLATSWSAFGKAYFFACSELIEKADVIAVVTIEEPVKVEPLEPFNEDRVNGRTWTYGKQAKMRVEKVLKGAIPDDVILYGDESFICAKCNLTKGRFLAFLTKDGQLWVGANWHLSLRPIQDAEVKWYVSENQRHPMEFKKLDDVVAQIQAVLKKQQSEPDNAGQSATHFESEPGPEGSAKPQPKSDERSQ